MGLRRGLSLGWRLGVGLLLAGALVFVTQFIDWRSPSNAFLGPLSFPLIGLIALLSSILIQSFSRRFSVFEVLANAVIVFVLGCLLFPAVIPDHSRRRERPPPKVRPVTSLP
jgi:cytochrome bd-type quinol oxidase subunit 2